MPERKRVEIGGVVQGVGFRPFVHRLAGERGLAGFVRNTPAGVALEVEGATEAVASFLAALDAEAPPLARLTRITIEEAPPTGAAGFAILPSTECAPHGAAIAPDTAPCAACLAETLDPSDRRFTYPFTNCTHCGPRYTLTRGLPYDRPQTTMAAFRQCAACQREYDDPASRRFHAQPNACPECGPELRLGECTGAAALARARELLAAGAILAIKNVGGYQLACDAANQEAVARLRARKRRPAKPLALLAPDLATVERVCEVDASEQACLRQAARPILLLRRRAAPGRGLAAGVAPGQPRLGVMLPSSPLHELLFRPPAPPLLVMTSGNRSSQPMIAADAAARRELHGIADAILEHNREIHMAVDDSVAFCCAGRERLIRRARGYVPQALDLGPEADGAPAVLAAGAELKNSFCLTRGREAFLGPHIGDMANLETAERFHETLKHYLTLTGVRPTVLAYDPHPGYQVTRRAREVAAELGIERAVAVQHHHAHIASCMAENHLRGPVIGVAWDGTGYGADGTIWGGEFLVATPARFVRHGSLRPVGILGGDTAVREPWRVGLAYLADTLGEAAGEAARTLWPELPAAKMAALHRMLRKPGMAVPCSSAGRLFDAVAAIAGVTTGAISYEAEAAMALEAAAGERPGARPYSFQFLEGSPWRLDLRPMIAEIILDRGRGRGIEAIATQFHATMAAVIGAACERMRAESGLEPVCLSGGSFQNRRLLEETLATLRSRGFAVYLHSEAPCNDGGLGLGQAVVAAAVVQGGEQSAEASIPQCA